MERKDPAQGKMLRHWFEHLVRPQFNGRILGIDEFTASLCASLHVPDRNPENDAWIAATAIRHNLTLVTRNRQDFDEFRVKLLNPFED